MVRGFAQYCRALDARTEVPPHGLLPYRYRRQPPYIYREQEIAHLLTAARQLPSATGLRPSTYTTLLGLLAVTGMRLSEALHLDRPDVEVTHGSLTIRQTKFGKTRCMPLHPSTREVLHQYARFRDQLWPRPSTLRFLLSERGTPLTVWSVQRTVVQLSRQIGLRDATARSGPRLHDLRHSCAVRTLLHWYRTGADVERRMPTLSAYLGHAHVNDTFWYLSATPELFHAVTQYLDTDREEKHDAN
jgi:integrase